MRNTYLVLAIQLSENWPGTGYSIYFKTRLLSFYPLPGYVVNSGVTWCILSIYIKISVYYASKFQFYGNFVGR